MKINKSSLLSVLHSEKKVNIYAFFFLIHSITLVPKIILTESV